MTLDFSDISSTSLQVSPYKPGSCLTIALDDMELDAADARQYERFWRVWCFERAVYAPKLELLQIVLRISGTPYKGYSMSGIKKFLYAFDAGGEELSGSLKIYIDSHTCADTNGMIYEVHTEPECIFDSSGRQPVLFEESTK